MYASFSRFEAPVSGLAHLKPPRQIGIRRSMHEQGGGCPKA